MKRSRGAVFSAFGTSEVAQLPVPAIMTLAQIAEILAMWFLLPRFLGTIGIRGCLPKSWLGPASRISPMLTQSPHSAAMSRSSSLRCRRPGERGHDLMDPGRVACPPCLAQALVPDHRRGLGR